MAGGGQGGFHVGDAESAEVEDGGGEDGVGAGVDGGWEVLEGSCSTACDDRDRDLGADQPDQLEVEAVGGAVGVHRVEQDLAGAEWLHLVDLDAAFGRGDNRELQARIVGALDIRVEMSGGIRDDDSLTAALGTGCRRVNIGTAALEQPEWCAKAIAEHGDQIAVGLDVRGRTLAARGWTRDGGDLYDVLARLDGEGCARYVVTDVNKDGMLQGPNLELLRGVCATTDAPVVASGGITELADLSALMALVDEGVEGAIVGTALYEGRFTLEDALALTWPDRP